MRIPFAFWRTSGGGSVPVVTAVTFGVVDPAGGGERVVVTVDSSTGCTAISAGGVAFTSFAIDNATHVSGIPGAHAAGVVNVVVTNATGPSTTGTGLIEYFKAHDLAPTLELLPGAYVVTGTQAVDAVGTWTDASGNGYHAAHAGPSVPAATADATPLFDSLVQTVDYYLAVSASLASATGSPPDIATLSAGTQIVCLKPDASATPAAPAAYYEDACLITGSGASAGLCYNTDGVQWEAYDEVSTLYERTLAVAAAVNVKHFAAGRWNGSTWGSRVNGSAWQNVTADATVLSDGNVGAATQIGGGTYASAFDGEVKMVLVFKTALSDANVTKIRAWAQQRGWAA